MRIRFLLLNAYAVGGTVRTVITQANALAAAGHDVEITSVWRTSERPPFPVHRSVRLGALVDATGATPAWRRRAERWLMRSGSRLVPRAEVKYDRFSRLTDRRLVRHLRSLDGGVLVTTRPALNLLSARFAPDSVVRVGQEHLHRARHRSGLKREIARWYGSLDALTVLTAADGADYRTALAGSATRIEVIPNPLADGDPARSALDRPLVVAAGRLVKSKGFDVLIRAFEQVVRDHQDWRLRIYGSGPEHESLRALIHERHLYNHVHLMGRTADMPGELAKASVFALSSQHEGFGMVLVEAMSHGVPVVSFDCPVGPGEIITHGEDGILVPNGDEAGLASAITRLVADERLRTSMGEAAAAAARRYRVESIRPRWEALFGELLDPEQRAVAAAAPPAR